MALLVRLADPVRVRIIADTLDREIAARVVAKAVGELVALALRDPADIA